MPRPDRPTNSWIGRLVMSNRLLISIIRVAVEDKENAETKKKFERTRKVSLVFRVKQQLPPEGKLSSASDTR